jgi:MFS family permease
MLIGRALFGIGAESMYVGQSTMVSEWFINFELSFAISLISCIPLFGSLLNGYVTPRVYEHKAASLPAGDNNGLAFGAANLIGFLMQIASLAMVIFIVLIDAATEKTDKMLLRQYKKELRQRQIR